MCFFSGIFTTRWSGITPKEQPIIDYKYCSPIYLKYAMFISLYVFIYFMSVEASETRGTTALVYWLINSSLYTGAVHLLCSVVEYTPTGLTVSRGVASSPHVPRLSWWTATSWTSILGSRDCSWLIAVSWFSFRRSLFFYYYTINLFYKVLHIACSWWTTRDWTSVQLSIDLSSMIASSGTFAWGFKSLHWTDCYLLNPSTEFQRPLLTVWTSFLNKNLLQTCSGTSCVLLGETDWTATCVIYMYWNFFIKASCHACNRVICYIYRHHYSTSRGSRCTCMYTRYPQVIP